MSDQYKYTIVDGVDHIVDEKGNTFVALRKMYWGDRPESASLEIRKWYNTADGGERASKGCTFLTEDGPNNLTHTLLGMGFGNTQRVLENIKDRPDFRQSLNTVLGENDTMYDRSVPTNLYVPNDDLFEYDED